jgi:hypothetical protein
VATKKAPRAIIVATPPNDRSVELFGPAMLSSR